VGAENRVTPADLGIHLSKSWPDVLRRIRSAADVTLGDWALVADRAIEHYGDVIVGVYDNEIVTTFDIDQHNPFTRGEDGRVRFNGTPSSEWGHLVGETSPVTWVRGQARPVRYLDTQALRSGTVEPELLDGGDRRAVLGEFTLTVTSDGTATLLTPAGGAVTVISRAA
jgi:hypothetical protein